MISGFSIRPAMPTPLRQPSQSNSSKTEGVESDPTGHPDEASTEQSGGGGDKNFKQMQDNAKRNQLLQRPKLPTSNRLPFPTGAKPSALAEARRQVAEKLNLPAGIAEQFSERQIENLSVGAVQKYILSGKLDIAVAADLNEDEINNVCNEDVQKYVDSGATDLTRALSLKSLQVGNLSHEQVQKFIGNDRNNFEVAVNLSRTQIRDVNFKNISELVDKGALSFEQATNLNKEHFTKLVQLNHERQNQMVYQTAFSREDMLRVEVQNILLEPTTDDEEVGRGFSDKTSPMFQKASTEGSLLVRDDLLTGAGGVI